MNAVRDISDLARAGTLPRDPASLAVPMNAKALLIEVRRAIREEVRAVGLLTEHAPALPPPADLEAETRVVGALLSGEVAFVELEDLRPSHFFVPFHRWIGERVEDAISAKVDLTRELLLAKIADDGLSMEALAPELDHLLALPFRHPDEVRKDAIRLHELARLRALLDAMRGLDVDIRSGATSLARAIEIFSRWSRAAS